MRKGWGTSTPPLRLVAGVALVATPLIFSDYSPSSAMGQDMRTCRGLGCRVIGSRANTSRRPFLRTPDSLPC
eukprot:scaffold305249_cov19-Prasinocladus_malaysianus.AAC.1